MKHQVVITSNGVNQTNIVVDGVALLDVVTEIKFIHKGGDSPVVRLEIAHCDITIKTPQIPQLPEVLNNFYKSAD